MSGDRRAEDATPLKEDPAVTNFREYLRIKTVQPNPDYDSSTAFLKRQASELSLPIKCIQVAPGFEVIVITWIGSDPELKSILLNSHIDVVPVFPDKWKYDPFGAVKTENGDIYARGAQDMKCVGIQYLEAIRRLRQNGFKPLRTIHVIFVPDEEVGGLKGMRLFVETEEFVKMNAGLVLDEGLANPDERFKVFNGERVGNPVEITCEGNPGHGSRLIGNTAAEKMKKIMDLFLGFREHEKARLEGNLDLTLGDVTTINLTKMEGGVQGNVIPSEFKAVFDIRIPPAKLDEMEKLIESWIAQCGEDISYKFVFKAVRPPVNITSTAKDDPWWQTFSGVLKDMNLKFDVEIFSAGTDSRYIRGKGYPAFGFSPMNNTPVLLHDHNEFLNEKIFLEGINIYCRLISALSHIPSF